MKLVEELGNLKPDYIIITGDGRSDLKVLKAVSERFNGQDLVLFFPLSPLRRKSGKSALDSIKNIPGDHKINSIIYIVDGDTFDADVNADIEIRDYLLSIGIDVINIESIGDAFLINCEFGNYEVVLYCIISGPQTFIEEEIAELIKLTLNIEINLTGERNIDWKKRVKREVNQALKANNIKLENLIKNPMINKLETAFPNICAILKKIEEDFHNSSR